MPKNSVPAADVPCDFLEFLAQQGGIEVEAASMLLGELLLNYEPGLAALERAHCSVRRSQPRRTRVVGSSIAA
jgi:hypothetical protein